MRTSRWGVLVLLMVVLLCGSAAAESTLGATVNVRATRDVRDSVIRAGEDVDLLVTLTGFEPTACQWYFADAALEGESGATLHLEDAQVSDTGVYRMDAIDEAGRVRISVDVALRVVDSSLPQTGDRALSGSAVRAGMAAAALAAVAAGFRRRKRTV